MIIGREKVVEHLRRLGHVYWVISKNEEVNNNIVTRSREDEALDFATSFEDFKEAMDLLGPDTYWLSSYPTYQQRSRWNKTKFVISSYDTEARPGLGAIPTGAISPATYYEEQFRHKWEEFQLQQRIKDLERQLAEKAKIGDADENDGFNRFLNITQPYLPAILAKLGILPPQAAPAINGTGEPTPGSPEARVTAILERWAGMEADWINVLDKLVSLCANDQNTYNMARTILMSKSYE